jgi:hypothetical protein
VLVGLLSVATMPAAVVASRTYEGYELLDAGYAIPVGAALGVAAVAFARRARLRIERTLGRAGGARTARGGRLLGLLGFCLATSGAIAIATYAVLTVVSD